MIPRTVVLSPEAEQDLADIYDWIAGAAGASTALAYIERVESHLRRFDLAAERGSARDDIRPGLRIAGFERSLTIAFSLESQSVVILRVFRRGRNWAGDAQF